MTDQSLERFVDRLNADPELREAVRRDAASVLAQYDLKSAKDIALATDEEDLLRRLAASSMEEQARIWTWVKKKLSRVFCGPGRTRSWDCTNQPPK